MSTVGLFFFCSCRSSLAQVLSGRVVVFVVRSWPLAKLWDTWWPRWTMCRGKTWSSAELQRAPEYKCVKSDDSPRTAIRNEIFNPRTKTNTSKFSMSTFIWCASEHLRLVPTVVKRVSQGSTLLFYLLAYSFFFFFVASTRIVRTLPEDEMFFVLGKLDPFASQWKHAMYQLFSVSLSWTWRESTTNSEFPISVMMS